MQTKNTKATWRKKDIDRIIKDRIIRDVWTLFKTKEEKTKKKFREKNNDRLNKERIIRDIWRLFKQVEEEKLL